MVYYYKHQGINMLREEYLKKKREARRLYVQIHKDDPIFKAKAVSQKKKYDAAHRDRVNELARIYNTRVGKDKRAVMLKAAKGRAKRNGLDFDICYEDILIPEFCPVLGLKLSLDNSLNSRDTSPSLDRKDSSKGYIKGNVYVISWRANKLKSDATLEEISKIKDYMSR